MFYYLFTLSSILQHDDHIVTCRVERAARALLLISDMHRLYSTTSALLLARHAGRVSQSSVVDEH
jgi:hypothetical protein